MSQLHQLEQRPLSIKYFIKKFILSIFIDSNLDKNQQKCSGSFDIKIYEHPTNGYIFQLDDGRRDIKQKLLLCIKLFNKQIRKQFKCHNIFAYTQKKLIFNE